MPKNDEGDFELVLGNKQLLSVFFLVVVLLGVFFTMGYIIGRNSAPLMVAEGPDKKGAAPITVDPGRAAGSGSSAPGAQQLPPGQAEVTGPSAQGKDAQPAEPSAADAREASNASAPAVPTEPAPGQTFLQVLATARTEADLVAETLRKKGFSVQVAPSPNPALFRVLVGPFKDTADLAHTREALFNAGFPKPIVRTYK